VAAKLKEMLSVCKRAAQKFDMQRFDLRKLDDAEVKEQYQVRIRNRFAALEDFDDNMTMNRAWENIQPKRALVITSYSSINHGLIMNVQN
jgi:poly-beta-hydroxyalkanoate depolymerase